MPKIVLTYMPFGGETRAITALVADLASDLRRLVAAGMNEFYGAHEQSHMSVHELGLRVVAASPLDENYPPLEICIHSSTTADSLALQHPGWLLRETVKPILQWLVATPLVEDCALGGKIDVEYIINGQQFGCTVHLNGEVLSYWPLRLGLGKQIDFELAPPV